MSENNHFALAAKLLYLREAGIKGVIIDAETPQALALIVAAAQTLPVKPLLGGAAGLSDALAQALRFTPPPRPALLAVVGTMSEMTQKQIAAVSSLSQVKLLDVDILLCLRQRERHWRKTPRVPLLPRCWRADIV